MRIYLCLIVLLLAASGCYTTQSYLTANEQPLKIHPEYKDYYNEFMEKGEEKLAVSYHYLKTRSSDGTYKLRIFYPETKQILSEETYNKYFVILKGPSKTWLENGELSSEGQYQWDQKTGQWIHYINGKIWKKGNYIRDKETGIWKVYDDKGRLSEERNYGNRLPEASFIKYDTLGNAYEKGIYKDDVVFQTEVLIPKEKRALKEEAEVIVEEMPEYPGGQEKMLEFLYTTVKYPVLPRDFGVQGLCVVSFVVGEDGNIKDIEVRRGLCEPMKQECIRVVKLMPKWKPAYQEGKAVEVRYNLPIRFKLGR